MSTPELELKLPNQMNYTIYIPVYTYDGVVYKGLDATFNMAAAKSRLKSVLPDAWKLSIPEMKDHFTKVRCGLAIVDLKQGLASPTWVEFSPNDLTA